MRRSFSWERRVPANYLGDKPSEVQQASEPLLDSISPYAPDVTPSDTDSECES